MSETEEGSSRQDARAELNRKLRQAFVDGAEERSRRVLGRGLTMEELGRVLQRYPGDLPQPDPAYDSAMDLACVRCRAISWDGVGAMLEGTGGGGAVIEAEDWQPGGAWKCVRCGHDVANPSPKQDALDEAVTAWLAARRG